MINMNLILLWLIFNNLVVLKIKQRIRMDKRKYYIHATFKCTFTIITIIIFQLNNRNFIILKITLNKFLRITFQ